MFRVPDCYHNVSLKLSKVLYDIGVNEEMILKRRRMKLLHETMDTAISRSLVRHETHYMLGSHSEGTTTRGLNSDVDVLTCLEDVNILQDLNEWTLGNNFLMIQNDSTPPGYCLLQQLRPDVPLPDTEETDNDWVRDARGRLLLKNTILDLDNSAEGSQRQGPSWFKQGRSGILDQDRVMAMPFTSCPQMAKRWLIKEESGEWPTKQMKRYAGNNRCFVVGGTSKISEIGDFEWRISTALAERCLMFNLNITQIRCYVLMKMLIKAFLTYQGEHHISSYMCKTVLLHCIKKKNSNIWKECNILSCLTYCLLTLHRCILARNCPHFIINENNLMAGKLSVQIKTYILDILMKLIQCNGSALLSIKTDSIGDRLQMGLNIIDHCNVTTSTTENMLIAGSFMRDAALTLITLHTYRFDLNLSSMMHETLEVQIRFLVKIMQGLAKFYRDGTPLERAAFRLLMPLFCTSFGSLTALHNIRVNNTVSAQAIAWFSAGLNSDVSSSRLKLATLFYCTGNMERTLGSLVDTEERYRVEFVEPICPCNVREKPCIKTTFCEVSRRYNENALRYIVAFCVRFLPVEIRSMPRECIYEMFRSTRGELRSKSESWMDCAVIDSLPYLYFLTYKTYSHLHMDGEKQLALNRLRWITLTEDNLAHRETALNLLGQCMEQEKRYDEAFQCYVKSLNLRARHNAARLHICRLIANSLAM